MCILYCVFIDFYFLYILFISIYFILCYCRLDHNRFAALEYLNDSEDLNRAWENIKDNIKTSATESLRPV